MNQTNPTAVAQKRYLREMTLATCSYVAILIGSVYALNHGVHGPLKIVVAVVPAFPIAGIFVAIVRWLQSTDEFLRQTQIIALAIAGGSTALITVTYGFLENGGLPRMSVWVSYLIFMTIWGVTVPIVQRRSQ